LIDIGYTNYDIELILEIYFISDNIIFFVVDLDFKNIIFYFVGQVWCLWYWAGSGVALGSRYSYTICCPYPVRQLSEREVILVLFMYVIFKSSVLLSGPIMRGHY
jgi:hypothetical protein